VVDERVEQETPNASTVVLVDHRDGQIGAGGVCAGHDVSGDTDAEPHAVLIDVGHPRGVFCDDGHVMRLVDVEEPIEKGVGQIGHAGEEAGGSRRRSQTREPGQECIAVVGCAEPQSEGRAIVEFDTDRQFDVVAHVET